MAELLATDIAHEYEAAQSGAILFNRAADGRLRATGRDRLDLLHRMSTNDTNGLRPGQARPTVLTTAVARIVDLVWVVHRPDDSLILTSPGQGETVRRWLQRHIFFQDDVTLQDIGSAWGHFGLYGPEAGGMAEVLVPGARDLTQDHFIEEDGAVLLRARPLAGDGYEVFGPIDEVDGLRRKAMAAGAVLGAEETFEILRIEAGQPGTGHELTDGYIPLEANLWQAVSFAKGCYIGQEIIARMESRGKLAKTLVGLKLAAPVQAGDDVRHAGQSVGKVSSAAISPRHGAIALAFVKPAVCESGGEIMAGGVAGEIVSLPFR